MTYIRFIYIVLLPLLIFTVMSGATHATTEDTTEQVDLLGYVNNEGDLMRYNPRTRSEEFIASDVMSFALARDGRVAYTQTDSDHDLYIINPQMDDLVSINFDDDIIDMELFSWSNDGQYLALAIRKHESLESPFRYPYYTYLYLWDGQQFINIMPEGNVTGGLRFFPEWRSDNLLAFQINYTYQDEQQPDLFLWNGSNTVRVIDNPHGFDGGSSWSDGGQLFFYSIEDEARNIYIWDGISYQDGMPDPTTFHQLPTQLSPTNPVWVNEQESIIAFSSATYTEDDIITEIIWWHVEEERIIQRYTVETHLGYGRLAEDLPYVFAVSLASGAPSYYLTVENTAGNILLDRVIGEYAWSDDGFLAYCGLSSNGRVQRLTLWDGEDDWLVDIVSYQPVKWQSGNYTFSCNNG